MRFAYPPYGLESGLLFHSKERHHSRRGEASLEYQGTVTSTEGRDLARS